MRRIATGLLLLLLTAAAAAGDVSIGGDKEYAAHDPIVLTVKDGKSDSYVWKVRGARVKVLDGGKTAHVWARPGDYEAEVTGGYLDKGKVALEVGSHAFKVIGKVPGPVDPVDPPPNGKLARVLIVYESGEATKLSAAQQAILYGKAVRDELNARLPLGPDGKTREWRIWDKDVDASGEAAGWQALLKRPHKSLPWVVIEGDKGVLHEGPLPADAAAMVALVGKFAPKARKGGR